MPTKQGSFSNELFTDYPKDFLKMARELGKTLVPMKEVEFVYLNNEIQRLHRKLLRRHDEKDLNELMYMEQKTNAALLDSKTLAGLLSKRKGKELSLLLVSLFLFEFEGVYANMLDSFCLQLVMDGHDLLDPIRREYASSSSEIGDVDITTKFRFLERHNLKMLVRKGDQRLRNRIAHYDFCVNDDGKFSIDGQVVNIGSKLMNLMTFCVCVDLATVQAGKTILKKRQVRMTMSKNRLKTNT